MNLFSGVTLFILFMEFVLLLILIRRFESSGMVLLVYCSTATTTVFIRVNLFRITWRNLSHHNGPYLRSKYGYTLPLLYKGQNGETYAFKYDSFKLSFAELNPADYSNRMMGDFVSVAKLCCRTTPLYCMSWTCNVRAILTMAKNVRL
jgi:hypothetical protein